jgi:hypothetical protein
VDLIEDIGPILGIVAFLGFAILALLIVLQAREVRRLREWAGRAPERALQADEADRAAAEARGEVVEASDEEREPGRLGAARSRVAAAFAARWAELDHRSPIDPRWFLAALLAALIAVGVVTSGFGLVGGDDEPVTADEDRGGRGGGDGGGDRERARGPTVSVLNATQDEELELPAVPGIADVVAAEVVEPAGFRVAERTNAPAGEERSLIMFQPESEADAQELAEAVEPDLGPTDVVAVTGDIAAVARGSDLVLLVGLDDAEFGQTATTAVE